MEDSWVDVLIKNLKGNNDYAIRDAARRLGSMGGSAVAAIPALIKVLDSDDFYTRINVIEALGDIGAVAEDVAHKKLVLRTLVELAASNDDSMFTVACSALRHFGVEAFDAIPSLIKALESPAEGIVRWAAWVLASIGQAAAIALPHLISKLGHEEERVRAAAGLALIAVGYKEVTVIPALIDGLDDMAAFVRRDAARGLGKLGPYADSATPLLIQALQRADPESQRHFQLALIRVSAVSIDTVPTLIALMRDEEAEDAEWVLRCDIAEALGDIGSDGSACVPTLVDFLHMPDVLSKPIVFRHFSDALERIGFRPVDILVESIRHHRRKEPRTTARALALIGQDGVTALKTMVNDFDPLVSQCATEALLTSALPPAAIVSSLQKKPDPEELTIQRQASKLTKQLKVFYIAGYFRLRGASSMNQIAQRIEAWGEHNTSPIEIRTSPMTVRNHMKDLIPLFCNVRKNDSFYFVKTMGDGMAASFSPDWDKALAWTIEYLRDDKEVGPEWWGFKEFSLPKDE